MISFPKGLTLKLSRQLLIAQKHSPRVLFGAGIAGIVGSTVLACRATLKVSPILDDFKHDIDQVNELYKGGEEGKLEHGRDLTYVYAKGSGKLLKLYGPSILLGGASITALTYSHVTLTRRNAALTSAYSALALAFDQYRDRVRDEVGEERERELRYDLTKGKKPVKIGDEIVDLQTLGDPNKLSPYARLFDEYNRNWNKDPEINKIFILAQQNHYNNMLQVRGHVFLNEVYDALGLERSKAGQVCGWVLSDNGDNYIDFGIYKVMNGAFVEGKERSILLDFNVDGVMYDKI